MRIEVDTVLAKIAGWLLPPRCLLCHGPGQPPVLDLCAPCASDLPRIETACPRCGVPGTSGLCDGCAASSPPFDACFAPFVYDFPIDGLIQALKYHGQLAAGRVLGTLLGTAVVERGLHLAVDVIVPVPLHPMKLAERGFNQSVELSRWVAKAAGRPCQPRVLARTRPTRPQVGLTLAERSANLAGAFIARPSPELRCRRVALIDDVMTTGGTARAAAAALRGAGAASVAVWCVARTPARPD